MKNLPLPQHINTLRFAEQTAGYHGSLLIKNMQRLAPSLYHDTGEARVDLMLGTDEEGTHFCRVQVQADLILQCQRCMEPYTCGIISDFVHGVVNSEREAETLAEQYEPVIARDGMLIVQDMIEDELILKLPIVPMHSDLECKVKLPVVDSTWVDEDEGGKSPFHVLKLLKHESK